MENTAYLMALLEVDDNKTKVKFFTIISDQHPTTCDLQQQVYAIIDSVQANSYDEAKELLITSVQQKARYSEPNSLWHQIKISLGEK